MSNAGLNSAEQNIYYFLWNFLKALCKYFRFLCKCLLSHLPLPLVKSVFAGIKKQNWSQLGLQLVLVLGEHHWVELGVLQRGRDSTYHCQCHCVLTICFAELSKAQVWEKSPEQRFIGKTTAVVVIHTEESNLPLTDTMRASLCMSPLLQKEFTHNSSLLLCICVHALCVKITHSVTFDSISIVISIPLS